MQRAIETFVSYVRKQNFHPGPLGVITNPFYMIRRGLYRNISDLAGKVTGKVLDYGCGSKPYEELFQSAESYTGIDVEVSGHDHAKSKIDVFFDGLHIPFGNDEFDTIVCFEVLEHVFEIGKALAEIYRVLTPSGILLLSTPFAWDEHETPYDFGRYTSFGMSYILKNAGFEILEIRKTNSYFSAIAQMLIAYIYLDILPRNKKIKRVLQPFLISPLTIIFLMADKIFPRSDRYYSNIVVLARKR